VSVDPDQVYIAGYQAGPGEPTTPLDEPTPIADVDYGPDLEDAHRVLYMVEGEDGNTHWYWRMDGVEDYDDAWYYIQDLVDDEGEYGELG
jgi:hypothetical protein